MGIRTVFNILGPLCNPAGVKRYLIGVYSQEWVQPMAQVLAKLGCERAWVVHGADGLDELSTTGSNYICEVKDGEVTEFNLSPEDAGLPQASLEDLKGGDATYNAQRLNALLDGEQDAYRDVVLFGAGAALVIAGKEEDIQKGVSVAAEAIDSGRAKSALAQLVAISNS
jgi:anthranilate phosphoribosyltransferase